MVSADFAEPLFSAEELGGIIPKDSKKPFDIRKVRGAWRDRELGHAVHICFWLYGVVVCGIAYLRNDLGDGCIDLGANRGRECLP